MNMVQTQFTKIAIILLIIGGAALGSFAQTKCDLQFGVYEFKADGSSEQFPVKDSKLTLVDPKTNKSLETSLNGDFPSVRDLVEGDYQVTVTRGGFKKTAKKFVFNCGYSNEQNVTSEIVFLWVGTPEQTFEQGFGEGNIPVSIAGPSGSKVVQPVSLVRPEYPPAAMAVRAKGVVQIEVTINELGHVIAAKAVSGHALLRAASVNAAKKSKFGITSLEGIPVKVTGTIVFNFG